MTTKDPQELRRQLSVEIFDLTGLKADLDDPFITAALFYSSKMRQSAAEIDVLAEKVQQTISNSIADLRKAADEVQKSIPSIASQAAATSAAAATQFELSKAKGSLALYVEGLRKKIQSSYFAMSGSAMTASEPAPPSITRVVAGVIMMTALGGMVGATCFGKLSLTPKQIQEMQYGRALFESWPYLDKPIKEKLAKALNKRMPHAR